MARPRKKKTHAEKPKKSKGCKPAVPPPDNPLVRHEELSLDRFSPEVREAVSAATLGAAQPPGAGKKSRPPRGAAPAAAGAELLGMVHHRLLALQQTHAMETLVEGLAAATLSAPLIGTAIAAPPVPQTANWTQLGPSAIPNGQTYSAARVLVTGRVTSIVVDHTDAKTVYVGTAQGGVWKTSDGCHSWRPTSDDAPSLAIGAIVMDPSNHLILYAGTGEGNFSGDSYYGNGVLRTTDGGVSWTNLALNTFAGNRFSALAITPGVPARLLAATNNGVYRTIDSGTTWALQTGMPTSWATNVVIDPLSPTRAFAAFWGNGIYRTTNADAAAPTWTKLTSGLPASGFTRVALAIAHSAPTTLYALIADAGYTVNQFLRSTDSGDTWQAIALPGGSIGGQGFYNLDLNVDPTTPDIVYLSGVSLWKATRSATTNTWTITDIGGRFHPDNHALAFDPTDHLQLYAGSDGGIYHSTDGGAHWDDRVNQGLCITQFEFIAQHPTSGAQILGGTQDNGTEQYRNSPVFYHSDDGDGGACCIDSSQPNNMLSTYYGASPKRSTTAGRFTTWSNVAGGLAGNALFYPPMAMDDSNSNNVAFGTNAVYFDGAQGTGGWPASVAVSGGRVSALHYVNSTLAYAGTEQGSVFRLTKSGANWTAEAIHAAPLPNRFIWDVTARPDDSNIITVVMSGFGTAHVWRGNYAAAATTWTDVSGTAPNRLPDIPVNAFALDPSQPNAWFVGTDIGVFRTNDAGANWMPFRNGLPNCAVFDLKFLPTTRLLRAATHGRGLWEIPVDAPVTPEVDLVIRDHLMDTCRVRPTPSGVPANWDEPLQHVLLNDPLYTWQCADIKIDAIEGTPPAYQMPVVEVDYLGFESRLAHRNPQRGQVNRIYVQVLNRGFKPALNVRVKVLATDATLGLPKLPADFWTAFPGNSSNTANWQPIGATATVPTLQPFEPIVLEWDWPTPNSAADHSCVLVIVDSASDPIPPANKILDVGALIGSEKRVGLKNLHVVNAPASTYQVTRIKMFGKKNVSHSIRCIPSRFAGEVGFIVRKGTAGLTMDGVVSKAMPAKLKAAISARFAAVADGYDLTKFFAIKTISKGGMLGGLKMPNAETDFLFASNRSATMQGRATLTLVQESESRLQGGSTFSL